MPVRTACRRSSSALLPLGYALASLVLFAPRPAGAETVLTWSDEARRTLEVDLESPALRTLRLLEEEWFGSGPARPETYDPDCIYGTPDSLSSEAPPAAIERDGRAVDLRWLSELELPNIPVRWDDRVISYLLFFKNDPSGRSLLASWLKRQEIYGPMIRQVLAEASLPSDLQYVAMVESGFDPRARSYAAAQGLWQFMRRSASHYGLRIDRWVDERLDPEKATHAAVDFLGDLYRRLDSWELAFAAYNMGYGGLIRSIRKYNTNDYWLLSHMEAALPYETALYVSKITAVAIIAHNRDRFGFSGLQAQEAPATVDVEVAPGTYLKPMAAAAGVDKEVLVELNPQLRRARVPPGDGPWKVRIPAESFERFAYRWRFKKPVVPKSHTVRFGERLEDVARTYRTTPRKLRAFNEMAEGEDVEVGEILFVPGHKPRRSAASDEPPVVTVPAQDFALPGRRRVFYRIASHDTLDSIARFFEVQPEDLATWNELSPSAALQRNMFLQIFVDPDLDIGRTVVLTPEEVTILVSGSEKFFDFHERQRDRVRVRYVAQPGDTLGSVGERFELSAGSVARINQFSSKHELTPGEHIILYVPEDTVKRLRHKGLLAPPPEEQPAKEQPPDDAVSDAAPAPVPAALSSRRVP